MIRGSFTHARGIGPVAEKKLRDKGFQNWDDCFSRRKDLPFSSGKGARFISELQRSSAAHQKKDLRFLLSRFPVSEHWRILAEYINDATFFDIETTGLSWHYNHASVIAALHRGRLCSFVCGVNLDDFLDLLDEAEMLVTFNGGSFDLPFIEKTFHIPPVEVPHVDLRWVAYHQGYRGGLKRIESRMNIHRPPEIGDIDGFEAVELYYRWQSGDSNAGRDLVRYCRTDVVCTYMVACRILYEKGVDVAVQDRDWLFREALTCTVV